MEMRQIDLPTLVIWGADDKVFSPDNAERLRNDIEGAEVHLIDDSGHLPQIEQTNAFLGALLPFLRDNSGLVHEKSNIDISPAPLRRRVGRRQP